MRTFIITFILLNYSMSYASENILRDLEGTFDDAYLVYPAGDERNKLVSSGGSLKLTKINDGAVEFELYTVQPNHHSCIITGIAKLSEESLIFRGSDYFKDCKLVIYTSGENIEFYDEFGECRKLYCGAQGSIEQTIIKLPK